MKCLIASRNRHKCREIREIFGDMDVQWLTPDDVPGLPEVVEDGSTFEQNAVKKALTLASVSGCWALADDSGLEVDALGGKPGVYSARYAGDDADDEANLRKLLEAMAGKKSRRARFRCVIALAAPDGCVDWVEGCCHGNIAFEAKGAGGFGYDPVFVPDGEQRTFAEMSAAEKNALSHRGHALQEAKRAWITQLGR